LHDAEFVAVGIGRIVPEHPGCSQLLETQHLAPPIIGVQVEVKPVSSLLRLFCELE